MAHAHVNMDGEAIHCDAMKDEFLAWYKKDFNVTRGTMMDTFLGMVVEQSGKSIKIHLDNYVKDVQAPKQTTCFIDNFQ